MRTVARTVARTVVEAIADRAGGAGTLTVAGSGSAPDACLPWRAVYERARCVAAVLARQGIGPGDRVGLLGETSIGLVTALQAVWLSGAAGTILPHAGRTTKPQHLDHLRGIVAHARFSTVIVDEATCDAGPGLSDAVRVTPLSILEGEADRTEAIRVVAPGPDNLAVLQYTSGSTSTPRGVPVTHANLAANLDAIEAAMGLSALDPATACWVSWLPLYHDLGLIGFLVLPMTRGCPVVLSSPISFALHPASWLERLTRHRATATGAPNFAYALMTRLLEAGQPGTDLSPMRHMFSGGEPIDATMMARFVAAAGLYGLDPAAILPSYGLAESTLAVSIPPRGGVTVDEVDREALEREGLATPAGDAGGRRLVRLGPPVPGTRIRIVDEAGQCVAGRAVGHIEVCGPSVVDGYWGEPARPAGTWLRTGDLGYLTGDELVVCGRAKDVLFAAGRNVYPQDVEAAAAQVPGVRPGGAAAFGIPAETGDRLVVAVETRSNDSAGLRRAVIVAVAAETGMAPADVVTLRHGRLPKTSSGKLRRAETRRRYLAGELANSSSPLTITGSVR